MRPLILQMQISVDGFVCGPNGELDWIFKNFGDATNAWIGERVRESGLHLMGSRTFKDMAAFWPFSREAIAAPMNDIPKAVFSRTSLASSGGTRGLEDAVRHRGGDTQAPSPAALESWRNPLVLSDIARDVPRLKQEDGKPILAHGGASFAQALVASGLIDEYRLLVHPVALGRGQPLFSQLGKPLALKLVGATPFPTGVVAKIYRPA